MSSFQPPRPDALFSGETLIEYLGADYDRVVDVMESRGIEPQPLYAGASRVWYTGKQCVQIAAALGMVDIKAVGPDFFTAEELEVEIEAADDEPLPPLEIWDADEDLACQDLLADDEGFDA